MFYNKLSLSFHHFIFCKYRINYYDYKNKTVCLLPYRCKADTFRCNRGVCINRNKVCNGVVDCQDGDDEAPEMCNRYVHFPLINTIVDDCLICSKYIFIRINNSSVGPQFQLKWTGYEKMA